MLGFPDELLKVARERLGGPAGHQASQDGLGHHRPQAVTSERSAVVNEKRRVLNEIVKVRNLLAWEHLSKHRVNLWNGIEAAQQDVGKDGTGIDEPLAKIHGLGVASERAGHVGRVIRVTHAPVDVRKAIPRSHEGHQAGVLLVSDEAPDLISKDRQGDDNIHLLILDDILNIRMKQGTSRSINTNINNL